VLEQHLGLEPDVVLGGLGHTSLRLCLRASLRVGVEQLQRLQNLASQDQSGTDQTKAKRSEEAV
jgi:hypothetical protein